MQSFHGKGKTYCEKHKAGRIGNTGSHCSGITVERRRFFFVQSKETDAGNKYLDTILLGWDLPCCLERITIDVIKCTYYAGRSNVWWHPNRQYSTKALQFPVLFSTKLHQYSKCNDIAYMVVFAVISRDPRISHSSHVTGYYQKVTLCSSQRKVDGGW